MAKLNEDQTIRLMLGYLCIASEKEAGLVTKVEVLDRFGFSDSEIASICGCKDQSVRDARQKRKKSAKGLEKNVTNGEEK